MYLQNVKYLKNHLLKGIKMILTERNPQKSFYFLGSELLKVLKDSKYTLFGLYDDFKHNYDVSIKQFILVLDWLFLAGIVEISKDGFIKRCI